MQIHTDLAKFPNAKILDIEEIERNNENDG